MKKIVLFLLIAAMLVPLAACGGDPAKTPAGTAAASGTAADTAPDVPKTEAQLRLDTLPERDFDGDELHIASASQFGEFVREEANGELFNDAVYDRNLMLEEKYNISITEEHLGNNDAIGGQGRQLENRLREDALAGDCNYQIIADTPYFMYGTATDGIYRSLTTLPWLDLSASYWDQTANEMFTIGGKLYFTMGSLCIGNYGSAGVIFLNRDLAEDLNITDLYEKVWNGVWTIDDMIEYSKIATIDLDGNGKIDNYNDQWGTVFCHPQIYPIFPIALGFRYTQKDESGSYKFVVETEKNLDIIYACEELVEYSVLAYDWESFVADRPLNEDGGVIFNEGRALFYFGTAGSNMSEAECNYGILPIPKYDAEQENYMTSSVCYQSTVVSVPRVMSEADADKAGFMLEVMAALSEVTTFPTYVEKLLEMKKSPDPDSTRVLQLVFSNMTYDFMYSYYVYHFPRKITKMIFGLDSNHFVSMVKDVKGGLVIALEDLELAFLSHES